MKYGDLTQGTFLKRCNRFIAEVIINDHIEQVHVMNTGRLKELLIEQTPVLLAPASNPNRKTRWSLVCIKKNDQWVCIDSTAPNRIVEEMVREGRLFCNHVTYIKREKTFEKSRFDLYIEHEGHGHYIEVKGVTLECNGVAKFPDAPTERGVKHVRELIEAVRQGYQASIVFVIQMKGVYSFEPNKENHPEFAVALKEAAAAGVEILAIDCRVTEDAICGDCMIPVKI